MNSEIHFCMESWRTARASLFFGFWESNLEREAIMCSVLCWVLSHLFSDRRRKWIKLTRRDDW